MKKVLIALLVTLLLMGGISLKVSFAQNPPLSFNLLFDKSVYNPGDPIQVVMTLMNTSGREIYTSKGFSETKFHLFLYFTDPDGRVLRSNQLKDITMFTPINPPQFVVGENLVQGDPIEILQGGQSPWILSLAFNALDYYSLTKGGLYSVHAKISMRTYEDYETSYDIKYARIDSPHQVWTTESNTIHFTLLVQVDHIAISPSSSTITAGGNQLFKATGYDQNNNNLGDVTPTTTFSIAPDGSCTGNICAATVAGPHTITGNYGGKIATASLQVNAGQLDHIALSPASSTIVPGGSQVYTAVGYDQYNNSLGDVTPATSLTITPDGSCNNTTHTCTATIQGLHTVTGNDGGKTATATLIVGKYNFSGFFSPVDNPPTVNNVNAGQNIPVKWRITDANGVGISDPSSFVSLTSQKADCNNWKGIQNPVTEFTSGTPELKYNGDGNWQINWKTPKNYAGMCRIMTLKLKDGGEYVARFKFK